MDIDYFKDVNDTYGHIAGDLVLQSIGKYLLSRFRDGDILGRIGGDEFVMFMKNVDTVDHMVKKVRKVSEEIPQIVIPDLNGAKVSVSIGVSYAPDCGQTYLDLYHHADEALYETKRKGRNGYTVFCK